MPKARNARNASRATDRRHAADHRPGGPCGHDARIGRAARQHFDGHRQPLFRRQGRPARSHHAPHPARSVAATIAPAHCRETAAACAVARHRGGQFRREPVQRPGDENVARVLDAEHARAAVAALAAREHAAPVFEPLRGICQGVAARRRTTCRQRPRGDDRRTVAARRALRRTVRHQSGPAPRQRLHRPAAWPRPEAT